MGEATKVKSGKEGADAGMLRLIWISQAEICEREMELFTVDMDSLKVRRKERNIERDVKELSNAIDSLKFLHFITAVAAIDRDNYIVPIWMI